MEIILAIAAVVGGLLIFAFYTVLAIVVLAGLIYLITPPHKQARPTRIIPLEEEDKL